MQRNCSVCDATGALSKCARCHVAYYCDRKCQRVDWPEHKLSCSPPTAGGMPRYESMLVRAFPTEERILIGLDNETHGHYSTDKVYALANYTARYINEGLELVELFDLVFMLRVTRGIYGKCGCEFV
jgi:hypothetical protein